MGVIGNTLIKNNSEIPYGGAGGKANAILNDSIVMEHALGVFEAKYMTSVMSLWTENCMTYTFIPHILIPLF